MRFEVDLRDGEVNALLRTIESDQLPFATMLAVNQTAKDFQSAERARLTHIFTIRRKQFASRSIKIRRDERATKTLPEARVRVDSPGGRSDIFAKFEADTSKTPFRGRSIAVPTEHVPRTGTGVIRKAWRPRELLKGAKAGRGRVFQSKGDVFYGQRGTFLIRRPGGRGTIFRRVGSDIFALYQLVPRVRIKPDLEFVDTARRTVANVWANNFTTAFDRSIGIR